MANALLEREITFDPVPATCVKVVYKSTWGGKSGDNPVSPPEKVGSLAEFNADIAVDTDEPAEPTEPGDLPIPDGALEITDGQLSVRLHPEFPQVVDYRLGDDQLAGRLGAPLTYLLINEKQQPVTVGTPVTAAASVTYPLSFPNLESVSFDAVFTIADEALTMTLTNLVDPNNEVNRVRFPNHNLVTVKLTREIGRAHV